MSKLTNNNDRIVSILIFNASIQIFVSTALGFIMLIPLQPWGGFSKLYLPSMHALLAVHLDWYMLAFLEFACAFMFNMYPSISSWNVALLLMFGGWVNPMAYLLRGYGINAFVFGGGPIQLIASSVSGISVVSILVGWSVLLYRFYKHVIASNKMTDKSQ